jgi:hypothetical protein
MDFYGLGSSSFRSNNVIKETGDWMDSIAFSKFSNFHREFSIFRLHSARSFENKFD